MLKYVCNKGFHCHVLLISAVWSDQGRLANMAAASPWQLDWKSRTYYNYQSLPYKDSLSLYDCYLLLLTWLSKNVIEIVFLMLLCIIY